VDDVEQPAFVKKSSLAQYTVRTKGRNSGGAPNNILVLELLEEADLSNGSARHALVLGFKPDLLERDDVVRGYVARLVDDTVRACVTRVGGLAQQPQGIRSSPSPRGRSQRGRRKFGYGVHSPTFSSLLYLNESSTSVALVNAEGALTHRSIGVVRRLQVGLQRRGS
jgi:hypothetical protein